MKWSAVLVGAIVLAPSVVGAAAPGEAGHGSVVMRDPDPDAVVVPNHGRWILYLNRDGGTFYAGGSDNSSENVSWLVGNNGLESGTIRPWSKGEAAWQEVFECSKLMWERFDIEVTDVDPGDVTHLEVVVSGFPSDIGDGSSTLGVATMMNDCSPIERAIVYAFADRIGNNPQRICEVIAQEASHAMGLDHEYLCTDPMTYLEGCGAKTFQDAFAQCGEFSPRPCKCGGNTQNSVERLLELHGTSDPEPPTVSIVEPTEGATVHPGFRVVIDAQDNGRIARGELWIDGEMTQDLRDFPFEFTAPIDLTLAEHTVEVRIYDGAVNMASDTVVANVQAECATDDECPDGEACGSNRCALAIGAPCALHEDCASVLCVRDAEGQFVCSQECGSADCPSGYSCDEATALCWPSTGGGGGCSAGSATRTGISWGASLLLAMITMLAARSRRARRFEGARR